MQFGARLHVRARLHPVRSPVTPIAGPETRRLIAGSRTPARAHAGQARTVTVNFPADYGAANLAGKEAVFDVTVKAVGIPGELKIDDEFAKGFGLEGLDKLREAVRGNIEGEFTRVGREKLKRALLDALRWRAIPSICRRASSNSEFAGIWQQVEAEQKRSGKTFADENTTEEAARADYRKIAERRVRLGLLLAEVARRPRSR